MFCPRLTGRKADLTHSFRTPVFQLLNPPEEIESMADSYFQRIYTAEQSIEEVRLFTCPVVTQASAHLLRQYVLNLFFFVIMDAVGVI